jgi:diguanylate cyclase (GGDEF)-like protein
MTFHGRLRVFFAIIVIVPMLAIAVVLFSLTADSERGKADAGIATGLSVGFSLYDDARNSARDELARVANDDALKRALSDGNSAAAARRFRAVVRSQPQIVRATLRGPRGASIATVGSERGVAPAVVVVGTRGGGPALGNIGVSVTHARRFVRSAAEKTRLQFAILRNDKLLASTVRGVEEFPREGDFEVRGRDYRGRRATVSAIGGVREDIGAFQPSGELNSNITTSRLLIATILLAFLLLALATSVFVVRALQGQVGQFLDAARRLASGRFDQPVPIEGNDEFAQLGREFNNMSEQLAANIREVEGQRREVEEQRRELEEAIRQIGRAMVSGLDRQGTYELTVQTAVNACSAEAGRAVPFDLRLLREATAGSSDPSLLAALEEAERAAVAIGPETGPDLVQVLGSDRRASERGPVAIERGGVHAVALVLQAQSASRAFSPQVGVLSIARRGRPFTPREVERLEWLGGQAAISLENADLHETVQRQAITDELTGLSNDRQMKAALDREFERRKRFEAPLALVMLDLDDFKKVNDTYGHPQGNEVLIEVARVLREITRDTDEPARWGGEEFAVILPQTDVAGAALLAERMRDAIDRMRVKRLDDGEPLHVTASFGVAAVSQSALDMESLVEAADQALYRAKAAGKNRVECAPDL